MKYTLGLLCSMIFVSLSTGQSLWYHYGVECQTIGLSQVSYVMNQSEKTIHRQQIKWSIAEETIEEISAILDVDYALRTAHIVLSKPTVVTHKSNQTQEKNTANSNQNKTESSGYEFCLVTVSDRIFIQKSNGIRTFPLSKIYLDTSDFLRSVSKQNNLVIGKIFHGDILNTTHDGISKVKARYHSQQTWLGNLQERPCRVWDITTTELKNFWAKAYVGLDGKLLGYELGNFSVFGISEVYAQEYRKASKLQEKLPYILDTQTVTSMEWECAHNIFPTRPWQKVEGNVITSYQRNLSSQSIGWNSISVEQIQHTKPTVMFPIQHPYILQLANEIRYGAITPVTVVQNIARWCYENLEKKKTPAGKKLAVFLGYPMYASSIAITVLTRACGIPSRIIAGLRYENGRMLLADWTEVYLNEWVPIHRGIIGAGAIFLTIYEDSTWADKSIENIHIQLIRLCKMGQKIDVSQSGTYMLVAQRQIRDLFLSLRWELPNFWGRVEKDPMLDTITLHPASDTGPTIVLQAIESPETMDEIITTLTEKMSSKQNKIEIVWQSKRNFHQGQAIEATLRLQANVYRVFLGQANGKIVMVLMQVHEKNLGLVEKDFQSFITSLSFIK